MSQVTPKTSGQVLEEKTAASVGIDATANQDTTYVLPVDSLDGTMLEAHVNFVNRGAEQKGQDPPIVAVYECTEFSFDAFGTVARILQRSYVGEHMVERDQACLDYFGPFKVENLFVDLAVDRKKGPSEPKREKLEATDTGDNVPPILDSSKDQVIVCENQSRAKAVCEVARLLNKPYVPFK